MTSSYIPRINISLPEKCCCLQLRTAGIIIGSIWTIPLGYLSAMLGIDLITLLARRSVAKGTISSIATEFEKIEGWHDPMIYQFSIFFSLSAVLFATGAMQIYGAAKERRLFMVPFMTLLGFFICVVITSEFFRLVTISTTFLAFFVTIVVSVVGVYKMALLVSYYKQLQERRQPPNEDDIFDVMDSEL